MHRCLTRYMPVGQCPQPFLPFGTSRRIQTAVELCDGDRTERNNCTVLNQRGDSGTGCATVLKDVNQGIGVKQVFHTLRLRSDSRRRSRTHWDAASGVLHAGTSTGGSFMASRVARMRFSRSSFSLIASVTNSLLRRGPTNRSISLMRRVGVIICVRRTRCVIACDHYCTLIRALQDEVLSFND